MPVSPFSSSASPGSVPVFFGMGSFCILGCLTLRFGSLPLLEGNVCLEDSLFIGCLADHGFHTLCGRFLKSGVQAIAFAFWFVIPELPASTPLSRVPSTKSGFMRRSSVFHPAIGLQPGGVRVCTLWAGLRMARSTLQSFSIVLAAELKFLAISLIVLGLLFPRHLRWTLVEM